MTEYRIIKTINSLEESTFHIERRKHSFWNGTLWDFVEDGVEVLQKDGSYKFEKFDTPDKAVSYLRDVVAANSGELLKELVATFVDYYVPYSFYI